MDGIFASENILKFYDILQHQFGSMPEYGMSAGKAIAMISEELHIGFVKSVLDAPQTLLRNSISKNENILFRREDVDMEGDCVNRFFKVGDGGELTVSIYPTIGYVWNEKEKESLGYIAFQIYTSGAHVMTGQLIDQAVTTNLLIKTPNTTGFIQYCGVLAAMHRIDAYDAFYFNIKNFKYVNNVLPFSQENDVLFTYANKLREFINQQEFIAHFGSDNFGAVILKERAQDFIDYISNLTMDFNNEGKEYQFTFGATIGAAHLEGIKEPGKIMSNINGAYVMARRRHHLLEYYSDDMNIEIINQKNVLAQFKPALNNNEFVIYYQPKVRVSDRMLCGAEALVRWKKDGVIVGPGNFIPILEKDGSICELDFYVLDAVCRFLKKLMDMNIEPIKISTNFSRYHLTNENLAESIVKILDKYDVPHKFIEVEITESEDFRDYAIMENLVNSLNSQGVSTSIDDFGTGYSSLNMLKKINMNLIKIDKSFIPLEEDYPEKEKDYIMFQHIISLAKALGMNTVAEGVETNEQFKYLEDADCDMVQGYLFDKPLPEDEFIERLIKRKYD